jgi:NADPH-dependent 2,4-dienoyl-CoA reductase/sulfur reductase-like enzyme
MAVLTYGCSLYSFLLSEPRWLSTGPPQGKYDVCIVGGGHNGLVAAAYLAKAGLATAVFERRHIVGKLRLGTVIKGIVQPLKGWGGGS